MDPRELVHRYIEILQTGEFDQLDEILAPDVYDHVGQQSGIQWWKDILSKVAGGFSDMDNTIEHVLVDGDHVAVHFVITGRQTGRFLPQVGQVEPSGKPFSWTHVHIFRISEGLIAEHWAVRDDIGLAKQVGAFPS